MSGLLGAGVVVMIVADAVIGARLVRLSLRTRRLPELCIGASLLGLGAIGYPLSIAARSGAGGSPEADVAWLAAAIGCQDLGCAAMAAAVATTFRPGLAWARGLAGALAAALLGSWLVEWSAGDFALRAGSTAAYWTGFAARVLPFAWSAAESWRYHGLLRRRLRLGLGDAAVSDRFRLWAISSSAVVCAFALFGVALLTRSDVTTSPWVLAPTSLVGCVAGVSLWLAFLPPAAYVRWLERRATSGPTPA